MSLALKRLGKYAENPAFAEFNQISSDAIALYHSRVSSSKFKRPLDELILRMMYVAEASSVALRLSASWALTHPAFSLCRDRYEQTVRFSWLVRQASEEGWKAYLADFHHTTHRLKNAFQRRGIDPLTKLDSILDDAPKDIRNEYGKWKSSPINRLASERDKLPGITNTSLDKETLELLYDSIYRQGSSVAHFDMWSINMLSLHEKSGKIILAPDPYMPIMLVLHSALFDLIMSAEAAAKLEAFGEAEPWNRLCERWRSSVKRTGILD